MRVSDSSLTEHMSNFIFFYKKYQRLTSRLTALPSPLFLKYLTALKRGSMQHTPCHRRAFISWGLRCISTVWQLFRTAHKCTGLCCAAEQEQQGLGAARPWAQGPGKNKTSKNCSQAGKAATLWLMPVSGWILLMQLPRLWGRCAQLSVQAQRGTWAGKQRRLCLHCRSKGTVWDSKLGHVAHKPSNAPVNPEAGWGCRRTLLGCGHAGLWARLSLCHPDTSP